MTTSKVSHIQSNPPPVLAYVQAACFPTHRGWNYRQTHIAFSNYFPNSCLRDLRTRQFHEVECALYARVPTRPVNGPTTGWDDETRDPMLRRMLDEIMMRSSQTDPAHGDWCADGQEVTVWVDASSLATGVAIEYDASWLRPVHADKHINLAELVAVLRGTALEGECDSPADRLDLRAPVDF